jgi:hypothetical protein
VNKYDIYIAGGEYVADLEAASLTKACQQFIATLDKPAKFELYTSDCAAIRYTDNYNISGNFVIQKKRR